VRISGRFDLWNGPTDIPLEMTSQFPFLEYLGLSVQWVMDEGVLVVVVVVVIMVVIGSVECECMCMCMWMIGGWVHGEGGFYYICVVPAGILIVCVSLPTINRILFIVVGIEAMPVSEFRLLHPLLSHSDDSDRLRCRLCSLLLRFLCLCLWWVRPFLISSLVW